MAYQPPLIKKFFHQTRRFFAKYWLSLQPALQIAITGSQGKTGTAQMIAKVLSSFDSTVATDVNLDTIYNVPITALKVMPWTKYAVFELGVDHAGEMDFHLEIVKPKIAVVTGISPVHTDEEHLGSLENLIKEKRKLIEVLPKDGYAILNGDDENVRKMAKYTKAKVLFYGTGPKTGDIFADNVMLSLNGTQFKIHEKTNSSPFYEIFTPLIGQHHVSNIMATYLVAKAVEQLTGENTSTRRIGGLIEVVKTMKPLSGRMSVEEGPLGITVLNDSLRANPSSTASGLETLSQIIYPQRRKTAVLAEMGELQFPEKEHQKIGRLTAKLDIDFLVAIGPLQKFVSDKAVKGGMAKDKVFWVVDVFEAAAVLKKILKRGDLLYLKGSLLRHVERVLLILAGKEVGCNVITCPFYHHCLTCPYLKIGYQNKS